VYNCVVLLQDIPSMRKRERERERNRGSSTQAFVQFIYANVMNMGKEKRAETAIALKDSQVDA
jgi:hypothetical protein